MEKTLEGHVLVLRRLRGRVALAQVAQLGRLPDIYPKGIPIGRVSSVDQNDVDTFKTIQVEPFADFSSLDAVTILVPKDRTG